jgi:phosphonate transport system ATP-binding protein
MIYQIEGLTKEYPTRHGAVSSLQNLDFNIREGEQVALLGPSGAGKTTLFRLLNATLRATSGSLLFGGKNVQKMSGQSLREMRRRIGTIYQQHHLVPSLTALENTLCGRLGRWSLLQTIRNLVYPSRQEVEEAMMALEKVGLADKRRARADELSGGQQQRLAIARVLLQDPDVILADEPVASLDPTLAESILSLLLDLAKAEKRTLVVALHDVEAALRHFPRIIALREGRIAFDAAPDELSQDILESLYASSKTSTESLSPAMSEEKRLRNGGAKREPSCAR